MKLRMKLLVLGLVFLTAFGGIWASNSANVTHFGSFGTNTLTDLETEFLAKDGSQGAQSVSQNVTFSNNVSVTGTLGATGAITPSGGLIGQTAAAAVAAGKVGEVISNLVAVGSGVSLTTATPKVVLSASLTAGDWDVGTSVNFAGSGTTIAAGSAYEISLASGANCTTPAHATNGTGLYLAPAAVTTTSTNFGGSIPIEQFNLSATTTVCAVATGTFTAGTEVAFGSLVARRRD